MNEVQFLIKTFKLVGLMISFMTINDQIFYLQEKSLNYFISPFEHLGIEL